MENHRVEKLLRNYASSVRAKSSARFFKTGKGEYGEGDIFLGVTVSDIRKVVKKIIKDMSVEDVEKLLLSPYHEMRLAGTLLFVSLFRDAVKRANGVKIKLIFKKYVENGEKFNNWDFVDASASSVFGEYLTQFASEEEKENILYKLIDSKNLWENRIAVVGMHAFIKRKEYTLPFSIIEKSLFHSHDLIHKANGWMLREIGKHAGHDILDTFLYAHAHHMPRTTLRYALEHYEGLKKERHMKAKDALKFHNEK